MVTCRIAVKMAAPSAPREDHDALTEWVNAIAFTERNRHLLMQCTKGMLVAITGNVTKESTRRARADARSAGRSSSKTSCPPPAASSPTSRTPRISTTTSRPGSPIGCPRASRSRTTEYRIWTEVRVVRGRVISEIRGHPNAHQPTVPRDEAARQGASEERRTNVRTPPSRTPEPRRSTKVRTNAAPNSSEKSAGAGTARVGATTHEARRIEARGHRGRQPSGASRDAGTNTRTERDTRSTHRSDVRTQALIDAPTEVGAAPATPADQPPREPRQSPTGLERLGGSRDRERRLERSAKASTRAAKSGGRRSKCRRRSPKSPKNDKPPRPDPAVALPRVGRRRCPAGWSYGTQSQPRAVTRTTAANARPTPGLATGCAFNGPASGGERTADQADPRRRDDAEHAPATLGNASDRGHRRCRGARQTTRAEHV